MILKDFVSEWTNRCKGFQGLERHLNNNEMLDDLLDETSFLPINANWKQRIWHIIHNKYEIERCPYCDESKSFNSPKKGYHKTCGKLECTKKAEKATCLEKYGFESAMSNPVSQAKFKASHLEKYGCTSVLGSKHALVKSREMKEYKGKKYQGYGIHFMKWYEEYYDLNQLKTEYECKLHKYYNQRKLKFSNYRPDFEDNEFIFEIKCSYTYYHYEDDNIDKALAIDKEYHIIIMKEKSKIVNLHEIIIWNSLDKNYSLNFYKGFQNIIFKEKKDYSPSFLTI